MKETHTLVNGLFGLLPELIQIHYAWCFVCSPKVSPKVGIVVAKNIGDV
jgi:hypothetical protein